LAGKTGINFFCNVNSAFATRFSFIFKSKPPVKGKGSVEGQIWVKSQSGKLELNIEQFDFHESSTSVVRTVENIAVKKGIKIDIVQEEKINMLADLNIFKTVLRNLITNAIKFTNPNGQIRIRAEKQDQNVLIAVTDNGIGMDEKVLAKLWEINTNYTTIGTTGEEGTGFGLKLCRELIERHGGTIRAESVPCKGSTFTLSLPVSHQF